LAQSAQLNGIMFLFLFRLYNFNFIKYVLTAAQQALTDTRGIFFHFTGYLILLKSYLKSSPLISFFSSLFNSDEILFLKFLKSIILDFFISFNQ
jgi:hypothetical protein